ncbi:MAG TPA: hypothetical protein VK689_17350 [Armatimonadota bacterium]|nr:hypothetical protein [Armatimonadota bacterium]
MPIRAEAGPRGGRRRPWFLALGLATLGLLLALPLLLALAPSGCRIGPVGLFAASYDVRRLPALPTWISFSSGGVLPGEGLSAHSTLFSALHVGSEAYKNRGDPTNPANLLDVHTYYLRVGPYLYSLAWVDLSRAERIREANSADGAPP